MKLKNWNWKRLLGVTFALLALSGALTTVTYTRRGGGGFRGGRGGGFSRGGGRSFGGRSFGGSRGFRGSRSARGVGRGNFGRRSMASPRRMGSSMQGARSIRGGGIGRINRGQMGRGRGRGFNRGRGWNRGRWNRGNWNRGRWNRNRHFHYYGGNWFWWGYPIWWWQLNYPLYYDSYINPYYSTIQEEPDQYYDDSAPVYYVQAQDYQSQNTDESDNGDDDQEVQNVLAQAKAFEQKRGNK